MIKNERQYRITKSEAQKFRLAIERLENTPPDPDVHPLLAKAEVDGLRSELEELDEELRQYEALRSGQQEISPVDSVQDIPQRLIEARIRAGLTQEQLAQKIGLKPQQLQRYEATDYGSASLARVAEIAQILNVGLGNKVPQQAHFLLPGMLKRLKTVGLSPAFVTSRLLPTPPALQKPSIKGTNELVLEAAQGIERVYGWTPAALYGTEPLDVGRLSASVVRFKLPARLNALELGAYVVYARYLALLVLQATRRLTTQTLSADPIVVRKRIIDGYGNLSFHSPACFHLSGTAVFLCWL
jgi:transcriptional regulator with XRE-family HTH domain